VTHHVELVLPAVGYLVRMLDGRIDVQGTTSELRERKILQSITQQEQLNPETPEPTQDLKSTEQTGLTVGSLSVQATGDTSSKKPKELVKAEERAVGGVSSKVYNTYFKARCVCMLSSYMIILMFLSSYYLWIVIFGFGVLFELLGVGEKVWVKIWTDHYPQDTVSSAIQHQSQLSLGPSYMYEQPHLVQTPLKYLGQPVIHTMNTTFIQQNSLNVNIDFPSAQDHPGFYIGVYSIIGLVRLLISTLLIAVEYYGAFRASKALFGKLLHGVVGTTMRWIDTTPSGRCVLFSTATIVVSDRWHFAISSGFLIGFHGTFRLWMSP